VYKYKCLDDPISQMIIRKNAASKNKLNQLKVIRYMGIFVRGKIPNFTSSLGYRGYFANQMVVSKLERNL